MPAYSIDDDIVISGFSGRLPESSNIEEFRKNLFDGIDLVTDDEGRWPSGIHGLPTRSGKIKDLASFDASFFGVHARQAHAMDPQIRILLELTYEAIIDAGINPSEIRGSKTGVFIAVASSESEEFLLADPDQINGYALMGCARAMFANRISYTFDFSGPSFALDTACSSSLYAIHQAVTAIRTGQCEAAIVGGVKLLLNPKNSLQLHRINMLNLEGKCKAFDSSGSGYIRSEACVVIFLQKAKNSKRVYATVVNTKVNTDGNKVEGITYPSGAMQYKLMQEIYSEADINPADVVYVEAHGTGTIVGDPQEVNSIAELFCKDRKQPLLIGSVKTNMGHPEPVSGLCAVVKMLIAMEAGIIPGNLHFKNPNTKIPALLDGRLKVVDRAMPWNGGLIGINSFGFGGANGHVVLRSNQKPKIAPVLEKPVPKIVTVSGRTEEAVQVFLDKIKENENDDEFVAMVQDLHATNIPGHGYRGYQILGEANIREIDQIGSEKRPIWYIFSGMGSQWSGMGRALFCIDTFQNSIRRCTEALKPLGIDLMNLILNGTDETFQNVINSFVTIAAIQIGLVDVLGLIGIQPDGIIGHSIGELGCGYTDGTITCEQTVLAAYWRGKTILEGNLPSGAMAAVGLSWEDTMKKCPPDIFPACHNGADSVTISGPPESMNKFVDELKKQGIFAKEVFTSGFAFHSKYIASAGPKLKTMMDKIIPVPKQRSSRWISSSIPQTDWDTPLAQFSSSDYYANNLLSPVRFHEALAHVPENAIVIEIGPHCLLQAILRRSLPTSVLKIGLQKRNDNDNLVFLLTNIGKLYLGGAQPKLSTLYPSINYPVGRGTPMMNSIIRWDHSAKWTVADFSGKSGNTGQSVVEFDLSKESESFISGHCIDGRILFPTNGYLIVVWKTFAKLRGSSFERTPVVFENLQFHRATIMPKEGSVKFIINIFEGTGAFEICESGSPVVSGKIRIPENIEKEQLKLPVPVTCIKDVNKNHQTDYLDFNLMKLKTKDVNKDVRTDCCETDLLKLATKDIYKDLRLRGYDYSGSFQGIKSSDNRCISGNLIWNNDWISFMETMIQFAILGRNTRDLFLPTRLQSVSINPQRHLEIVQKLQNESIPVYNYNNLGILKSGGVEMRGLKTSLAPRRQHTQCDPILEKSVFVPYENTQMLDQDPEKSKLHALSVLLQVVKENVGGVIIRAIETTFKRDPETLLTPLVLDILNNERLLDVDLKLATTMPDNYTSVMEQGNIKNVIVDVHTTSVGQNLHLILTAEVINDKMKMVLKNMETSLKPGGFILTEETTEVDSSVLGGSNLILVAKQIIRDKSYVLLEKEKEMQEPVVVKITEENFSWVNDLKTALKKSVTEGQKILVVIQGEEFSGIAGLMTCIRQEAGGMNSSYFFIQDQNAPVFSLNDDLYTKQYNKQLMSNVLKDGHWGSYRHLRLDKKSDIPFRQVEHAYINTLVKGDLSSLRWIESPLSYYKSEKFSGHELCRVYYAPLNFRDIMLGTGILPPDVLPDDLASQGCGFGQEFTGRDSSGRRVMGIVASRGLATTVLADPELLWEVPDEWTLEQAATIPVVYATSYYALVVRGKLRPGESVLIHSGSGGVGQASIAIALHYGCTVFTTVSSIQRREFLKKTFPQLTDKNIGNSRNTSFEQLVLSETLGQGVDLVLNSLSEELLQASVRCLATNGRFLEIGKFDLSNNTALGMSFLQKNTTLHGIILDALFDDNGPDKKEVVRLVYEGIKNGAVRPLPTTVFTEQQIEEGFRFIAAGKHIGKVLIKIRNEESEKVVLPIAKTIAAIPRTYMNPDKSYVLVGGLGGFGLELANWMITRGARNIILTSRSGIKTGYQALCVRRWLEKGIRIKMSTNDITTQAGTDFLLKEANKLAPVGGIVNLAVVIRDALIEDLEETDFKIAALPKLNGTKNLDLSSRRFCPELDFFLCFSSVASGKGNFGQSNYGFANSAMERIMEQRREIGLPGLAIQWGAIGDVGLVLETIGNNDTEVGGTFPQRMSSCLKTIEFFLQQQHPILLSMVLNKKQKSGLSYNQENILDEVANILCIKDVKTVDMQNTLTNLGMDSIMGTEIKQTLARNFDLILSPKEIRTLTFGNLLELSAGR